MLRHQQEWFGAISVLDPIDRQIADDVGHVAFVLNLFAVANHGRVVVDALAWKDVPMVEASWVGHEMPFADERGGIAGLLEQFWKGGLLSIEAAVGVVVEAVSMGILAVKIVARLGPQIELVTRQRSNRIPSLAIRSIWGVSSNRRWSP